MRIVPEEMREEFRKTIEWLRERAVARTRGLGTPLPWDPEWIIESLSDSTIYMAYYTVNYRIREAGISYEQLKPVFWDYVLLGKGSPEKVEKETGISARLVEELRNEFDYWYPLDSRHSGRDLVPNHLTFFIFHHAALFPRQKWPRQIVVNGFVMLEGKKMSKSLRNIIPLRRALRIYGPDTVRAAILSAAELLQDANFTDEHARSVMGQLSKYVNYVEASLRAEGSESVADRWLRSSLQRHIERVTEAFESLRLRAASITLLYEMENDAAKYLAMRGQPGPALREYVEAWTLMLAPIVPHLAEEMWRRLGHDTYVSLEHWPTARSTAISHYDELLVEYVERIIDDIKSILRVYKGEAREAVIAVASPEKWVQARIVAETVASRGQLRDAIRALIKEGIEGREAAAIARKLFEYMRQQNLDYVRLISTVKEFNEKTALEELKDYIAKRTGIAKITIVTEKEAEELPEQKKKQIMPTRPAILIK
jgi:leucyl-tRNA synthetase